MNKQGWAKEKMKVGWLFEAQHWKKWRVTALRQAAAGVKVLWRPRLGMQPLTKKAKPGRSGKRKGLFGRNSEQRGANSGMRYKLDLPHELYPQGPGSPLHSYWPPLLHCSQIRHLPTCCAQIEGKCGSLSGYWLLNQSGQPLCGWVPTRSNQGAG